MALRNEIKPVLKWVGGKTQILSELFSRFPPTMVNYHEPFLGGGSVLLGLLTRMQEGQLQCSGRIYASDLNPALIGLYCVLQSHLEDFLVELRTLQHEFSSCREEPVQRAPRTKKEAMGNRESYYYYCRARFNALTPAQRTAPLGAALFLFLNKTGFRGVYREGPHGLNVPYGHYANPGIFEEEHLRAVSELIQPVVFCAQPWDAALSLVQSGDMVYLDPPYAPEKDTSFVSYTSQGFPREQHTQLFTRCHELTAQDIRWMMSNADVPLVRDAFPLPYSTTVLSCRRTIHSKKPDSKTNEVLIQSQA